jgi:outer membrane protein
MLRVSMLLGGLVVSSWGFADARGLAEIYQRALAEDPALQAQVATLDRAKALQRQTQGGDGWSATGRLAGTQTNNLATDANTRTGALTVTVSRPIYDPELDAAIRGQDASTRASEASFTTYLQGHIVTVASAYFAVKSAEQDLLAATARVEAVSRQLDQATERLNVGIGTRVDVDQARASLDLARVALISSEVALDTARVDLGRLLAEEPGPLKGLAPAFVADMHRSVPTDVMALVDSHPAVVAKQESLAAAFADLDEAKAVDGPDVSVSSVFSLSDTWGSSSAMAERSNALRLTLNAPIWSNGVNAARIEVAMAAVDSARASLESETRKARRDIEVAIQELRASSRTVDARLLSIRSAASRVEATEAAYSVGSGDIVEVLNAKESLIAAERDYTKARHAHVLNQLRLDQAMGDLSESRLVELESVLIP